MEYITLENKKYLKNKLSSNQHEESDLFIYNDYLFKKIKREFLNSDRKKIIEQLSEIKDESFVTPIYGVKTQKNTPIGYLMNYYKDYETITNYAKKNNLSFNERKTIAKKICKLIKQLEEMDIIYHDIHSDNMIIKDNDIKIVDMDSVIISWDGIKNIQKAKIYIQNYLADLSFQILIGSDNVYKRRIPKYIIDYIVDISTIEQKEFLSHSFGENMNDYNTYENIDIFNETNINEMKYVLGTKAGIKQ